jgi:hypothetical protein
MKSPFYLIKKFLGGQLPLLLWRWHVGLLSKNIKKRKKKKKKD